MLAFIEVAFDLMVLYTVFCISLVCKTYVKEMKQKKDKRDSL